MPLSENFPVLSVVEEEKTGEFSKSSAVSSVSSKMSTVGTYDMKVEFPSSYATMTNENEMSSGTKTVTSAKPVTKNESEGVGSGVGISEWEQVPLSDVSTSKGGGIREFIRQMMYPAVPVAIEIVGGHVTTEEVGFIYVGMNGKVMKVCDSAKSEAGKCEIGKETFSSWGFHLGPF